MGNLHETLKGQTNFGTNDKEIQDMMKNKTSDIFSELDNPEYFKAPENTILGQLFSCNRNFLLTVSSLCRVFTGGKSGV